MMPISIDRALNYNNRAKRQRFMDEEERKKERKKREIFFYGWFGWRKEGRRIPRHKGIIQ
jgi:hypothetical protein|tara:strand:+ start:223 stop:402 length:180 start_codon:yes stop_codon:yes gene_type:complete